MMGEGMAPYADTEHRRGLFGIELGHHKPDAETTKADDASVAPELSPAAEVSPAAGDLGSEKDADTGIAEAAVTGASTSVESPDMTGNVDSLAGNPEGAAPVDLKDAAAEPGVGATETPDVANDAPPSSENVVTPLTPAEDLLGDAAEVKAVDVATESNPTTATVLDATAEAPAGDDATSTLDAMRAEEDAGKAEKPVGPDKMMDPSTYVAESDLIDDAMTQQMKAQESGADSASATEESISAEAPEITASTPEIAPVAAEAAPDAGDAAFPTLKPEADSDPATDSTSTAPALTADVPVPTMPESPLTLVDEVPSNDSAPEASTADVSEEETPGANEAVAEELASAPAAEPTVSETEVTPVAPEATLASVEDLAHKLSPADKARLIAALAGDMEQAA